MKKLKKIISLILCFIISFCSLLPVNAYAKSTMSWSDLQMYAYFDGYSVGRKGYGTITDTRKQKTCQEINFSFDIIDKLNDDDLLTVSMKTKSKRYGGFNVTYRFSIGHTLQDGYLIAEKTFKVTLGGNTDDYEFVENADGCVLTIKNIPIDYSTKFDNYKFYDFDVSLTDIEYVYLSGGDLPFAFSIDNLTAVTDSASNNFFGNILSWLKTILDSIKNLPSSIGSFITSLGDKISGFFTNLINNLKTWFTDLGNNIKTLFTNITNSLKGWFADVGNWFAEIGNKIGTFFDNIWENISDGVSNITQSIKDWWASVVEFFKNLVIPQEGFFTEYLERINKWFEEHLGFIYQSAQLIVELTQRLVDVTNSVGDPVVVISEIRLPYNNVVIVPHTTFDFNNIINADSKIKWVYNTYRTVVTAIMIYYLVMFGYNKLNEITKDRKDNEG